MIKNKNNQEIKNIFKICKNDKFIIYIGSLLNDIVKKITLLIHKIFI